jgi:hypothetical protein
MTSPSIKRTKASWTSDQISSLLNLRYKDDQLSESFKSAKSNNDRHDIYDLLTERFNQENTTELQSIQVKNKLAGLKRDYDRLTSMLQVRLI